MTTTHQAALKLSSQQIANQIVGAIEGGSNYWMSGFYLESATHQATERPWYSDPKIYDGEFRIRIVTDEDESEFFTNETLKKGLDWLAEKHPRRLTEILNENDDAETSDVFLQACIFGEIVYG